MCSLCGTLGAAAHWSEGGGDRTQVGARRDVLQAATLTYADEPAHLFSLMPGHAK